MTFLDNIKMGPKLITSFLIVSLFTVAVGIFGVHVDLVVQAVLVGAESHRPGACPAEEPVRVMVPEPAHVGFLKCL